MKEIKEALKEYEKKGIISCAQALKIAQELNISPIKVREELDKEKIKLKGCQFGIF